MGNHSQRFTGIALADVLMRCHWIKRILFLAGRVGLVRQAVNAFKKHLPDSSPVNLVFFKIVRSKTKFWQMLGRGTRLCLNLFGPGKDKEFFYIFDYCQNLEFFSQNPDYFNGSASEQLSTRLFKARLEMVAELDKKLEAGLQAANRLITNLMKHSCGRNWPPFCIRTWPP